MAKAEVLTKKNLDEQLGDLQEIPVTAPGQENGYVKTLPKRYIEHIIEKGCEIIKSGDVWHLSIKK